VTGRRAAAELRFGTASYRTAQRVIRRVTGLRYQTATVAGRRCTWLRGGRGEPLLLIHGFGDRKETFTPLCMALYRHFDLILVDMPGFGDAPVVSSAHITPPAQSRFLAAFLDALGLGSVHVCGQSMGGGLAARFVDDHPDRARSLTILSGAGPDGLSDEFEAFRSRGRNLLLIRSLADFEQLLDLGFSRPLPYPRPIRRHLASQFALRRAEHAGHFNRLLNPEPGEEFARTYPSISARTQVIYGRQERLVHPDNMHTYASGIPGATLHVLDNVGHNPHHEAIGFVAKRLRAMLR